MCVWGGGKDRCHEAAVCLTTYASSLAVHLRCEFPTERQIKRQRGDETAVSLKTPRPKHRRASEHAVSNILPLAEQRGEKNQVESLRTRGGGRKTKKHTQSYYLFT